MGSPVIFSGKYSKLLTQSGVLTKSGAIINHDGEKNYFPLGNAETINPWTAYNDGSGIYVDGTGGAPALTITQTSTNPLTGFKSFLGTAGNQYDSAWAEITIDREDRYGLMHLDVSYEVNSGTYANGYVQFHLWDVTNGRMILCTPTNNLLNVNTNATQRFTFQLSDSTSYRLIYHQGTNNSGYSVKFEVKSFGPKDFAGYATVQSDEIALDSSLGVWLTGSTTNPTFGSVTYNKAVVSRNGRFAKYNWNYVQSSLGTQGSGYYFINLNNKIDLSYYGLNQSFVDTSLTVNTAVSSTFSIEKDATNMGTGSLFIYDETRLYAMADSNGATYDRWSNVFWGWDYFNSVQVSFEVPILGWSSSAPLISEYDGRVVEASYYTSVNRTANNYIEFDTKISDTHNCVSGTGVDFKFTSKIDSYYLVQCSIHNASGYASMSIRLNADINDTRNREMAWTASTLVAHSAGSATVFMRAGEFLQFVGTDGGTIQGGFSTTYGVLSHISITSVSGAQQIQAGHLVTTQIKCTANLSHTNGNPIIFPVVSYDNMNCYNSTTGVWKSKVNGVIAVKASGFYPDTATYGSYFVYKNGVKFGQLVYTQASTSAVAGGAIDVPVIVDDELTIVPVTGTTSTLLQYQANVSEPQVSFSLIGSHLIDQTSLSAGGLGTVIEYDTAGSYSWTVPAGVSLVEVVGCGGGGGGASGSGLSGGVGGGGGAGSEASIYTVDVTPGASIPITIGAGGAGGPAAGGPFNPGNSGASGADTTFGNLKFKGAPGGSPGSGGAHNTKLQGLVWTVGGGGPNTAGYDSQMFFGGQGGYQIGSGQGGGGGGASSFADGGDCSVTAWNDDRPGTKGSGGAGAHAGWVGGADYGPAGQPGGDGFLRIIIVG